MKKRSAPAVLVGAGLVAVAASWMAPIAEAQIYEGDVVIVGDCEAVSLQGTGAHILDRDNTGTGSESWSVVVRDGSGTEIATEDYTNVLETYLAGMDTISFDAAPAYNPISVVITSLAGNGLPEVVDAPREVSCEGLPLFEAAPQTPSTRPEVITTTTRPVTTTTNRPVTTTTVVTTTTGPVVTTVPGSVSTTIPSPSHVPGPSVSAPADTRNCGEIGQVNIPSSSPLYRPDLDSDRDGIACESRVAPAARPIAANAGYTG